jgi:CRISPR-associated protein Cmr6
MIPSRRDNLTQQKLDHIKPSHPGLWFDKYMVQQLGKDERIGKDQKTPMKQLVDTVASFSIPPLYNTFFERWEQTVKQNGAQTHPATVRGRMVVGLGSESVLETSVALHRTYGVPYIPGSALKGLAATYAHQHLKNPQWKKGGIAHQILFGDTTTAGYITFYDALYIPGSYTGNKPLSADVITVHHPKYYQGSGQPPADWDSPTPIPFLSATGSYLVALGTSPGAEMWRDKAFEILAEALDKMGIGAKTSSGYGRLRMEGLGFPSVKSTQTATLAETPVTPEQARVNSMIQQVQQLRSNQVAGQIAQHVDRWRKLDAPAPLKHQLATAILERVAQAGRAKVDGEKAWYRELRAYLNAKA